MNKLDDDCLCTIFHWLPLRDQVHLALISNRFCDIIVGCIWSRIYREIYSTRPIFTNMPKVLKAHDSIAKLNNEDYQNFYALNVQHVEKLHLGNLSRGAFCSYLGRYIHRPDATFYFSFQYLGLIELVCLDTTIHDGHIKLLTINCPMLQSLHICSKLVSGRYLSGLNRMRRLTVASCDLEKEPFDEFLAAATNLEYLDIRWNRDLRRRALKSFGISLREIHMCEQMFHRQISTHPLPDRLGSIRKISIVCDITPVKLSDGWEILREEWIPFLQQLGESVKTCKLFYNSEAILDAMENVYYSTYMPIFPRMTELHIKLRAKPNRLEGLFSSRALCSLYVYCEDYYEQIVDLLQSCVPLTYIHMEHRMSKIDELVKFIEQANRRLDLMYYSRDVRLHLKQLTSEPITIRQILEERIGYELYSPAAYLKIYISGGNENTEQHWGRLDFELSDNLFPPNILFQ